MDTNTPQITQIQYQRAFALASSHGHEWTAAPEPPLPATAAEIVAHHERHLSGDEYRMAGISFSAAHTTGTGRLHWSVDWNGTVTLVVRTPGAKLQALRALRQPLSEASTSLDAPTRAAWDAYASTTPEAALQAQCVAALAALPALERALSDGAEVLRAVVRGGRVSIAPNTTAERRCSEGGGYVSGPAPRHWLCLRDALRVLGSSAEWPEDVAAFFARYDGAPKDGEAAAEMYRMETVPEASHWAWLDELAAQRAAIVPEVVTE